MRSISFIIAANVIAGSLISGCAALGIPKTKSDARAEEDLKHHADMVHVFDKKRDAVQFQAAMSRWQQGDAPGCRELIQQLLQRSPKHREGRMLLAELYLMEEKPQAALADIQKLAAEQPEDAEVEHLLGLLLEASGQSEQALTYFKQAAERDPENEVFSASYQTATQTESRTEPLVTAQK